MSLTEKRVEFIKANLIRGYSVEKIMKALKIDERRIMDIMRLNSETFKKIGFKKR